MMNPLGNEHCSRKSDRPLRQDVRNSQDADLQNGVEAEAQVCEAIQIFFPT